MAKIITMFNHKGGVGKTTNAFHIAWTLVCAGKKVLLIDADSQCNLTGLVLGLNDFDDFYTNFPERNLLYAVKPAFDAMPIPIKPIEVVESAICPNLFLIPGHLDMSTYEVSLGMAHDISNSISALKNLPGALYNFITLQAEAITADYVLIDLNPSLSSINQNLFCISDYFIIPAAPDFFSRMSIKTLTKTLPKWVKWSRNAISVFSDSVYPWPDITPRLLCVIMQNYSMRKNQPTAMYQPIIDAFYSEVNNSLVPALELVGMIGNFNDQLKYIKAGVPDYQGLVAEMLKTGEPISPVYDVDNRFSGIVGNNYEANKGKFKQIYDDICTKIIEVV